VSHRGDYPGQVSYARAAAPITAQPNYTWQPPWLRWHFHIAVRRLWIAAAPAAGFVISQATASWIEAGVTAGFFRKAMQRALGQEILRSPVEVRDQLPQNGRTPPKAC